MRRGEKAAAAAADSALLENELILAAKDHDDELGKCYCRGPASPRGGASPSIWWDLAALVQVELLGRLYNIIKSPQSNAPLALRQVAG